ncbi:MAG: hypothetical protein VW835_17675, partial [Rickettsiales bacterium]
TEEKGVMRIVQIATLLLQTGIEITGDIIQTFDTLLEEAGRGRLDIFGVFVLRARRQRHPEDDGCTYQTEQSMTLSCHFPCDLILEILTLRQIPSGQSRFGARN